MICLYAVMILSELVGAGEALKAASPETIATAADPDTAVFKTWFAAIQQDFLRLREAESQVSGREAEKGQKLRNAVRALLRQQEEIWA